MSAREKSSVAKMKQGWATKEVEKYSVAGDTIRSSARFVFANDAVKLLRQRDAQWKRAVKRRIKESDRWSPANVLVVSVLVDLLAAMKEGRK